MSELINNREYRKEVLKDLILQLHNGQEPAEVRDRFAKLIEGVSPSEISDMEQELIMEGMPLEEIQRLCHVHAAIFKGSIEDIHRPIGDIPGHPLHTFQLENAELEKLAETTKSHLQDFANTDTKESLYKLVEDFNLLWDIDKHYSRKENLLFPFLEKYGITAPPKVMWGVDDEIRDDIKTLRRLLTNYAGHKDELLQLAEKALNGITEMVFKERSILFPMAADTLTEDEWVSILEESDDIGYCLTEPAGKWTPTRERLTKPDEKTVTAGAVRFETGVLTPKEINLLFNHLPVDITFIDKDDVVKYFSQSKERIFVRTKAVVGRRVQNCHPPASVNIVENMLADFKAGTKDHEDFWIRMGENFVYIRYFAVRDENGKYIGTMEVTQNIQPIQEISGEKRLMSD